jgi:hypothetical protein
MNPRRKHPRTASSRRIIVLGISVAVIACLGGCGADPESPAPPTSPRLVGRIASIISAQRFVLIQSYGRWTIETGSILTTRGDEGRTANLRVTGEQQGPFAAADIQSGEVRKGDAVYTQHTPKPVTSPAIATDGDAADAQDPTLNDATTSADQPAEFQPESIEEVPQ